MISEEKRRILELFKEGRRLYTMQKFADARRSSNGPSRSTRRTARRGSTGRAANTSSRTRRRPDGTACS